MNAKKAKKLRKMLGYHPTDKRNYTTKGTNNGLKLVNCSRVAYQQAKKEMQ